MFLLGFALGFPLGIAAALALLCWVAEHADDDDRDWTDRLDAAHRLAQPSLRVRRVRKAARRAA